MLGFNRKKTGLPKSTAGQGVSAKEETAGLIEKLYGGSKKAFFAAFLQEEALSSAELSELRAMIERHEE